jgi:hypothetical protein
LPSTRRVWRDAKRQSQLGKEYILFLLMLSVCSLSSARKGAGRVVIPVESAIRTRREANCVIKRGRARRGLLDTFSSSKQRQDSRAGGRALRKLAEMSRASNVVPMTGRTLVRNDGKALAVLEDPMSKCVVPVPRTYVKMSGGEGNALSAHLVEPRGLRQPHHHPGL